MRKTRTVILTALLLLLTACAGRQAATPDTTVQNPTAPNTKPAVSEQATAAPSPSASVPAPASADAPSGGSAPDVILPKGALPQTAYAPPSAPPRLYADVTHALIPRSDYGRLWPYVGGCVIQYWMWGNLLGLCDEKGRIVCDPVYNSAEIIKKDGKRLYKLTKNMVDDKHKNVSRITLATLDGSWAKEYEGIAYQFPGWEVIGGHAFQWRPAMMYDTITVCRNGKWGVIDYSGRELLPCRYNDPVCFSEGLAAVVSDDGKTYTYIDTKGNTVLGPFHTPPQQKNDTDMYMEFDRLLPRSYGLLFSEGLARFYENGKYGVIDRSGKIIVPAQVDFITPFYNGTAEIVLGSAPEYNCGIIDRDGRVLFRPAEAWMRHAPDGTVLMETAKGPVALDLTTGAQTPWKDPDSRSWTSISGGSGGVVKWNDGTSLQAPDALNAVILDNGTIALTNRGGGTWYIANRGGKTVAGPFEGQAMNFRDGLIDVALGMSDIRDGTNARYKTLYDRNGKRLLPDVYKDIVPLDGRYLVRQDSYAGLLDEKGNWVIRTPMTDYRAD